MNFYNDKINRFIDQTVSNEGKSFSYHVHRSPTRGYYNTIPGPNQGPSRAVESRFSRMADSRHWFRHFPSWLASIKLNWIELIVIPSRPNPDDRYLIITLIHISINYLIESLQLQLQDIGAPKTGRLFKNPKNCVNCIFL